jgi:hypothetical protein
MREVPAMSVRRVIGANGNGETQRSDPTRNVLDLVNAAIARVDDLRESETRHQTEIAGLLIDRVESMMRAEANRIDAIRAVDVDAVQKASLSAAQQAATLASQVAQAAEAMRTQVGATATAATVALAAALEPIIKDVAELRRAQYEAQGQKTQIVETRQKGDAAGNWLGLVIGASIGVCTVVLAIAGVAVSIIMRS